jgi:hypothetical protein
MRAARVDWQTDCQSLENSSFPELLGKSGVPVVCQMSTGSLSQNRYFHAFPRALKMCDLSRGSRDHAMYRNLQNVGTRNR